MQYDNNKISVRQLLIIVIVATFSSAIQTIPRLVGNEAGRAGWVSILLAFGFYLLFILMLSRMFTKSHATDLYDLFTKVIGKFLAKIITAIYGIWTFILIAFYVRAFAERFMASILPNTPLHFFLIALLALSAIFMYGKFESFARFSELSLYLFAGMFVFLLAVSLPTIEVVNLFPVTTMDAVPILRGSLVVLGIWGYLTFGLFLGGGVSDMSNIKNHGIKFGILLALSALITFFITIGILGANWTERLSLPFFTAVQTIRLLNVVERLEALFLTFWMIADLVIVSLFMYVFVNVLKKLLPIKEPRKLTAPTVLGVYLLALVLANSFFELNRFSAEIAIPINVILGIAVPIVVFAIAYLRKKI